jgi:hypothetical protein
VPGSELPASFVAFPPTIRKTAGYSSRIKVLCTLNSVCVCVCVCLCVCVCVCMCVSIEACSPLLPLVSSPAQAYRVVV